MPDQRINDRTLKLLETISEIRGDRLDSEIFKLDRSRPDMIQDIMATQAALRSGLRNNQSIKSSMTDTLAKRTVFDSRTGKETIDMQGGEFSSITEFNRDELKQNLDAMRARATSLRDQLGQLQALIEKRISANPKQVEAQVDLRKNINLKNAVRRVFGKDKQTLTFADYKQAVQLKARFDKEEVAAAASDEVKF